MEEQQLLNITQTDQIEIFGAKENNLKNIGLKIPRNKFIVFTGLSGSGKSSLAFETIYAEAQRRYIETFPAYVKQFITDLKRPKVDRIIGLSPAIAIEQKTVSQNPRSTIGTITEIYDFLRLLYAKVSTAYSNKTGEKMVQYAPLVLFELILKTYKNQEIQILSPLIKGRKGQYIELLNELRKKGFLKVYIDETLYDLDQNIEMDRYKTHDIDLVIDRLSVQETDKKRLYNSLETALEWGKGVLTIRETEKNNCRFFSTHLTCPTTGESYAEPDPNTFSFNSPYGTCSKCAGIGEILSLDLAEIVKPKPIMFGGIRLLEYIPDNLFYPKLSAFLNKYGYELTDRATDLPDELIEKIIYGSDEIYTYNDTSGKTKHELNFLGILQTLDKIAEKAEEIGRTFKIDPILQDKKTCPLCEGSRLKTEALNFKIGNQNIAQIANLSLEKLKIWVEKLPEMLDLNQNIIATEIRKELSNRIHFLVDVGLDYLSLNRSSGTLSGGEAQRIRLATQIGTQLSGVVYILDEPSIGLHQSDNIKLISSLQKLRDLNNTILVVEHDKDMMLQADFIVDIGPKAGKLGGYVVAALPTAEFKQSGTLTAQYINGHIKIAVPTRRAGNGKHLILEGASGHNLKNLSVEFPLGKLIVVSGVSGSGKSSLIKHTLFPILYSHFNQIQKKALPYSAIKGLENIDKIIEIDQTPIGRTPRSNMATYVGFFTDIRALFALTAESKSRGYTQGTFSFNLKGGRCEACKGSGVQTIEMNFMPDVYVTCPACNGKRYLQEVLEIRYKSKSIYEVLNMSVDEALVFFQAYPNIFRKLKTLQDVGLGYITLGQSSTTFSGGEAQRMKLATELSRRSTGKTLYLMDEPTTGLHFQDIQVLMKMVEKLVDLGNTVLIIEHNLDVIKLADHIIDFGPKGGDKGGEIMATGTPEQVALSEKSLTAPFLREELGIK